MGEGAASNRILGGDGAFKMCADGGAPRGVSPSSAPFVLEIPAPPSINHARVYSHKNTHDSAVYRDWKMQVDWQIARRVGPRASALIQGHVIVLIGVDRSNAKADIDNLTKALLDALVRAKVIANDNLVLGVATAWQLPPLGVQRIARIAVMPAQNLTLEFHLAKTGAHGGWFLPAPSADGDD